MKKRILIAIIVLLNSVGNAQTKYYVSLAGDNSNSGLTEVTAWRTISYSVSASSPVIAGDTIFVKKGIYTDNVIFQKSGTITNSIVLQGYNTYPNDNPNINYHFGDNLDATVMPLINGLDRTTGMAMYMNSKKNIVIRNFQITNYEYGIYNNTSPEYVQNIVLDNIIIMNIGDTLGSYSGKGIELKSSNNEIKNCIVVNACAQGILVRGNNSIIYNCEVYCDDDRSAEAAMDYYIGIYNGNNNLIKDCFVERIGPLPHLGHGLGLKGNCENNIIDNCISKNFEIGGFYVRHRGTKYNFFNNCEAIGVDPGATGFLIRDGASNNTFNNCTINNCQIGIRFIDTSEDEGAQYCGRHNIFNNCEILDAKYAIDFNDYDQNSVVDSNAFFNCNFIGGETLINVERNNNDNVMINCIVYDYENFKSEKIAFDTMRTLSFAFEFSDFYTNGFSVPVGVGNINSDPQFVNLVAENFHLSSSSPCIDAGTSINAPDFDFEDTSRPQGIGFDIGNYEFVETTNVFSFDKYKISPFPNPTTGIINLPIEFDNSNYEIHSINGKVLKREIIQGSRINISSFRNGIYMLKITDEITGKQYFFKIIKE